jgi:hypothetical protein
MEVMAMKVSTAEKNGLTSDVVELLKRLTGMIPWPERRMAKADIVATLLDGKARAAEDVFGWGRAAIIIGRRERSSGERHADSIAGRRKPATEEKFPNIERDIHLLFDSKSQADARLGTTLRYLNASASNVRGSLVENGYRDEELPSERTINNLLNRMGFRLRTVQKAKPQKKLRKPT